MQIPTLKTNHLLLKPLDSKDALQIQKIFPRWEIVRYMVSSIPWPYPDNAASHYVDNIALPAMAEGRAWIWTIRLRDNPNNLIGVISLDETEDNNRGFWLVPEYQGRGLMREASIAATNYWFNTLNKPVLRAPKAAENIRSQQISVSSGMRLIKTEKVQFVCGLLNSELWEITRDEWNAHHSL